MAAAYNIMRRSSLQNYANAQCCLGEMLRGHIAVHKQWYYYLHQHDAHDYDGPRNGPRPLTRPILLSYMGYDTHGKRLTDNAFDITDFGITDDMKMNDEDLLMMTPSLFTSVNRDIFSLWYAAANQHHPLACFALGQLYEFGMNGVLDVDKAAAMKWYQCVMIYGDDDDQKRVKRHMSLMK